MSGGKKAIIAVLGVGIVLAAAATLFLSFGPVYGKSGAQGQGQKEEESSGETLLAREEQSQVSVLDMKDMAYQATGETPPEAAETETEPVNTLLQDETFPESSSYVMGEEESLLPENADSEYVLPDSNTRYYTRQELEALSDEELYYARNEIYARLGRKFKSDVLNEYFSSKSWYVPRYEPGDFDSLGDSAFNQYELANRNLIVEIEGSR